jgi:hypothetical protein
MANPGSGYHLEIYWWLETRESHIQNAWIWRIRDAIHVPDYNVGMSSTSLLPLEPCEA